MNPVVSEAEWTAARVELLEKEKQLAKLNDEVMAARAQLPYHEMSKSYTFTGKDGEVDFPALFEGKDRLLVYHAMLEDDWEAMCSLCSFWCDGFTGQLPHIQQHGSFAVIAHCSYDKLAKVCEEKGWDFPIYSSAGTSFNEDMGVGFSAEALAAKKAPYNYGKSQFHSSQAPGASSFYKNPADGKIYHAYSTYSRGLSPLNGAYSWIDLLAGAGRTFEKDLAFGMAWVKHKSDYTTPPPEGAGVAAATAAKAAAAAGKEE